MFFGILWLDWLKQFRVIRFGSHVFADVGACSLVLVLLAWCSFLLFVSRVGPCAALLLFDVCVGRFWFVFGVGHWVGGGVIMLLGWLEVLCWLFS